MDTQEQIERLKNQIDYLKISLSVVAAKQKTVNCMLYDLLSDLPKEKASMAYTKYVDYLEYNFNKEMQQYEGHLLSEHSEYNLHAQRDRAIEEFTLMKQDPLYHQD